MKNNQISSLMTCESEYFFFKVNSEKFMEQEVLQLLYLPVSKSVLSTPYKTV